MRKSWVSVVRETSFGHACPVDMGQRRKSAKLRMVVVDDSEMMRGLIFEIVAALPWIEMGLGQLTGSTSTVWDYFRPQDMSAFVLGFVGSVFALSFALLYWVFFMDGARKAVQLKLMHAYGLSGPASLTERQVKLFAGFGPLFVVAWIALCIVIDAPIRR